MSENMYFDDEIKKEVIKRCENKLYDSWNKYGVTINLPIFVVNSMLEALDNCKSELEKNQNYERLKTQIIEECLQIMENYAMHVTSQPETNLGQNITKNIAIHETIKEIKKHFNYQKNN